MKISRTPLTLGNIFRELPNTKVGYCCLALFKSLWGDLEVTNASTQGDLTQQIHSHWWYQVLGTTLQIRVVCFLCFPWQMSPAGAISTTAMESVRNLSRWPASRTAACTLPKASWISGLPTSLSHTTVTSSAQAGWSLASQQQPR